MALYDELTWGLELEMTGNTRCAAAKVLQDFFGVAYVHEGTHYDKYSVTDRNGRKWVVMSDSSITPLKKVNGTIRSASDLYKAEFVSPPLYARDIPMYQEIIRLLRKAGFFPSETCGIHIHIGVEGLSHKTIVNVLNQIHSKQDLLYKALGVNTSMSGRYRYCKRIPTALVENLKKKKPSNLSDIANIWYGTLSNLNELRGCRYPTARYHCVNLCRLFDGPYCYRTVEFRCFPSVLRNAGTVKSFIQLCLLLVAHCNEISKSSYKPTVVDADESEAFKFRVWLLKLGAIGPEFSSLRHHLLDNFGNQSKAWRRGERTAS